MALHGFLTKKRSSWPAVVSLLAGISVAGLFLIHTVFYPKIPISIRFGIFNALALGSLSPLGLYLLPAWKLRSVFVLRPAWEFFAGSFAVYLCLIWLLTGINQMMPTSGFRFRFDAFSSLLLLLGALSAPLLEEVLFRELLPSLFGKEPYFVGHLMGSILFAASHLPSSLEMFFYYVLAGGLLAVLRIQSGGLAYGLATHALANGVVALL